jgi:hypothetical protein
MRSKSWWYRQMLLALFTIGFVVGLSYYHDNYGVWRDLALEAESYTRQIADQ